MEEKEFNYINVIPLVDIMLVLLTIVLVTATFVVQGSIPVNLPRSKYSKVKHLKNYEIVITKKGEIYFEHRKLNLKDLDKVISSFEKTASVSILADRSAKIQKLVEILDVLKKHRLKRVFIKTELLR